MSFYFSFTKLYVHKFSLLIIERIEGSIILYSISPPKLFPFNFDLLKSFLIALIPIEGNNSSVSVSNLRAYCNVIELGNGGDYARAQASLLQGGATMKMVCPNIQSTNQVNSGANIFNVSSQSVDHLVAAGYDNARNGESNQLFQATPTDNAAPAEGDAANLTHFFQMGSNSIPQYGMTDNAYVGEISTANALGKDSPYNYNQLFLDANTKAAIAKINYLTNNYIIIHDLSLEGRGALHK